MTARLPWVSTTDGSAVKATLTVASGWIVRVVTLPTSTPAMRTNWPLLRFDTFAKTALYAVSGANRSLPNTANNAKLKKTHTTTNTARPRSARPRSAFTVCSHDRLGPLRCVVDDVVLSTMLEARVLRCGLCRRRERRDGSRLQLHGIGHYERLRSRGRPGFVRRSRWWRR